MKPLMATLISSERHACSHSVCDLHLLGCQLSLGACLAVVSGRLGIDVGIGVSQSFSAVYHRRHRGGLVDLTSWSGCKLI